MKDSTIHYDWLTTKEAEKYTRIEEHTLRGLFRTGALEAVKVGGTWRTTKQWCNEYFLGSAA